ncbi:hypothetical protein BDB00DRAFT_820652 [Zychaea mexicana]|uniref:uncharacterized protein n=1 Tax=Zychaea mexicana TaxID=64656 RepID=UPI0022FEA089|nr:uncharacterized protein BDB00DRAFT_820652 [Zychaea mexicana]KAI9494043.1 hypothetical protein BDB00DRAFT_820652 [Zychaea mexicana]
MYILLPKHKDLTITVDERMESFDWVVTCDPVGGDHPHPEIVCAELEQLQVSLQEAFQAEPQGACVLIYMPTNLTIFGTLNGHMTEFKDEYSNSCILNRTLTAAGLPGLVPFNEDGTYNTVKH